MLDTQNREVACLTPEIGDQDRPNCGGGQKVIPSCNVEPVTGTIEVTSSEHIVHGPRIFTQKKIGRPQIVKKMIEDRIVDRVISKYLMRGINHHREEELIKRNHLKLGIIDFDSEDEDNEMFTTEFHYMLSKTLEATNSKCYRVIDSYHQEPEAGNVNIISRQSL